MERHMDHPHMISVDERRPFECFGLDRDGITE
jgi:hypothetical protein